MGEDPPRTCLSLQKGCLWDAVGMQGRPSEDPVSLAFAMSSLPSPPAPPSGFLSSKAGCASLAVHHFLQVMGPPGGGRRGFPPVCVVSVLLCGSAYLCFALGCVGREGLAMTLLGVRNCGRRLTCCRHARLLCCLVLCDSWPALSIVPGAWSVSCAYWRSFMLIVGVPCRLCSLAVFVAFSV